MVTFRSSMCAISPDRCGPGPSSAMARKYRFWAGVKRSKRTRKKLASNSASASFVACRASPNVIGEFSDAIQLLEEVRITTRFAQDLRDSPGAECHSLFAGWDDQSGSSVVIV